MSGDMVLVDWKAELERVTFFGRHQTFVKIEAIFEQTLNVIKLKVSFIKRKV